MRHDSVLNRVANGVTFEDCHGGIHPQVHFRKKADTAFADPNLFYIFDSGHVLG